MRILASVGRTAQIATVQQAPMFLRRRRFVLRHFGAGSAQNDGALFAPERLVMPVCSEWRI
jgi:hypothetical protein